MLANRSAVPLVLTVSEVAAVVTRLDGKTCTARRVRYLLSGLAPTDAAPQRGRTRLYGPVDVALMRLAVRLEAQGVSSWVARVVLSYCRDEIVDAWASRAPVALVVRGVTGTLEPLTASETPLTAARVPLRGVLVGIERAIRQTRRARPSIWRWRDVPLHAVWRGSES